MVGYGVLTPQGLAKLRGGEDKLADTWTISSKAIFTCISTNLIFIILFFLMYRATLPTQKCARTFTTREVKQPYQNHGLFQEPVNWPHLPYRYKRIY